MAALSRRTVGVISDTHGVLRPEVIEAFQGVHLIIHAGDIGKPEVLAGLRTVARVVAVRGNMDRGSWLLELPETEAAEVAEVLLYVIHNLDHLDLDPAAAGFGAVIHGHTHRASVARRSGVLFLNPGAAGPFRAPSIGLLHLREGSLDAELVELGP